MKTWILVIVILTNSGAAVTTIPGYTSNDACTNAVAAAAKEHVQSKQSKPWPIEMLCIPGPGPA